MYPPEPIRPPVGAPITDTYLRDLQAWGDRVLNVATTDRLLWKGERTCIQKMKEAGQVR